MDPLEETLGPEVNSEYLIEDGVPDYPGGARPKQYSNVIVDDSPLQNQMQKNKECKLKKSRQKCDCDICVVSKLILYGDQKCHALFSWTLTEKLAA